MLRERPCVFIGKRLALELGDESVVVPHLEKLHLAEHVDLANHAGGFTETRWNQDASLEVELRDQPVEVHAIEELDPRRMGAGHLREPFLDGNPDRHGIDSNGVAGEGRDVHTLGAVLVLDECLEGVRDFQAAFVVNLG